MNTRTASFSTPSTPPATARTVLALLERLAHGSLEVRLPDGATLQFGGGAAPHATLQVLHWRAFERCLKAGDIGFAEGWIEGDWSTPDLQSLLALFVANRGALERLVYGSWWGSLAHRLLHRLRRNSRRGSAKNIHAHYDLGNTFYRLWLGPSMSYSSACFDGAQRSLEDAQDLKVRRVLREAGVEPGSRLLEIGCGWGGLAQVAASDFGARVTGITLSQQQLAWARERAGAGVEVRLCDYRDLATQHAHEPFDAVVSVEMFEAVGHEYWGDYFDALQRCLKPGGLACVQSITIRDDLFERYRRGTDFIQQYIFPGGLLPSVSAFEQAARRAGLTVVGRHAFGADYARTLALWRKAFRHEERAVRELGFDDRFLRIWDFYLCYCEAAFTAGDTDVVQFTLRK
jgi:cyclopropane-fatty-acyl-phospholipid synthase